MMSRRIFFWEADEERFLNVQTDPDKLISIDEFYFYTMSGFECYFYGMN